MRKRSEPHTFPQRLEEQRLRLKRELANQSDGQQRDELLARLDQLDTAAEMFGFLTQREDAGAR